MNMDSSFIDRLPDELLERIVFYLPPSDTVRFSTTCRRCNKITYDPLVWRRHCLQEWRNWEKHHDIDDKVTRPPAQTKWRRLYNERKTVDDNAMALFNRMLETQQFRVQRMEEIARLGYDVKDLMLKVRDETPDDAEDLLARRYHADAILGQIHRTLAIGKWQRLQRHQMISLEEALGAYDMFVLAGKRGEMEDIGRELDRIAARIRARDPEFDELSTRRKAVQIVRFLRSENLVGNASEEDYHALRNNFISIALFDEPHTSLPLQSVAIYCAVARRLGVNAKPSNYPHHVHAVIEAPAEATLDGRPRASNDEEAEIMHMDPWRSDDEVPRSQLTTRLTMMGAPPAQHPNLLGATSTLEIALRAGRNIMNSVKEAQGRNPEFMITGTSSFPDVEAAWYSTLWSMVLLGDSSAGTTRHLRRQCLPYLIRDWQAYYPEDLGLIERLIVPIFEADREYQVLMELITAARQADVNMKAPSPRGETAKHVMYKVGQHFEHARYGYKGFIMGWDTKCAAEDTWIEQMQVDRLPKGREQPFYNIVADDKSVRYVAQENITALREEPGQILLDLAGRYFKRWDGDQGCFVSNMVDEYPDDV